MVGIALVFPYQKDKKDDFLFMTKDSLNPKVEDGRGDSENENRQFQTVNLIFDESNQFSTLKNAVFSKKFVACFAMGLFTSCKIICNLI
jgi:hypothetical protein